MQKQVNFFERHVEWFALGLGGLFLLFMVFTYVLNAPVKTTVGNTELGPGEVDKATLDGPVADLKRDIARPGVPVIRQKEYVAQFVDMIKGSGQALAQLSGNQIHWRPPQQQVGPDGVGPAIAEGKPIKELPVPPPAVFVSLVHGRSRVIWQDVNWVPKRANEQPKMIEADKDWWSGAWKIDGEALLKAFEKAFDEKKIEAASLDPMLFMQTAIVDVQLERRQVLPNGKYGKPEVVKPLENSLKPPFPGKTAKDFEIVNYLSWVTETPQDVVEPAFYEILAGDVWVTPSEENDALVAERRAANKEDRKAMKEQQLNELRARNQQAAAARRMPRGRGAAFSDEMEMEGDEGFIPRGRGGFRPPVPPMPGRMTPSGVRPRAGVTTPQPQAMQVGAGRFPVQPDMGEIRIVAHDDTVEAGKTYQYRIRYQIFNPVYKSNAADPNLTKDFAIPASYSAWSKPTKIRDKVEFFLAKVAGEKAEFDVFLWREGTTKKSKATVSPGDAIGGTGWSLVDARGSGRRAFALIVDENGDVVRRAPDVDTASERYEDLINEVEAANPQVGLNR